MKADDPIVSKAVDLPSGAKCTVRLISWPAWVKVLETASAHIGKQSLKVALQPMLRFWNQRTEAASDGSLAAPVTIPDELGSAIPILVAAIIDALNDVSELLVVDMLGTEDPPELAVDYVFLKQLVMEFNDFDEMIAAEKNFGERIVKLFTQTMRSDPDPEDSPDSGGSVGSQDLSAQGGPSETSEDSPPAK